MFYANFIDLLKLIRSNTALTKNFAIFIVQSTLCQLTTHVQYYHGASLLYNHGIFYNDDVMKNIKHE